MDGEAKFNFNFVNYRYILAVIVLILCGKEYTVSLWGSDYLKCFGIRKRIVKFILLKSKKVSVASSETQHFVKKQFGDVNLEIIPFLIPNLEAIADGLDVSMSKNKKKKILCGTNGSPNQQFDKMIESLKCSEIHLKKGYHLIFHLAYGLTDEVEGIIKNFIGNTTISCEIVYDYLSGSELISFRRDVDILIQIQKTDQLSAAMFEYLVQNKLLITGEWLPYNDLKTIGVGFETVSNDGLVNELSFLLSKLDEINSDSKYEGNREAIISNYGKVVGVNRWVDFMVG